MAIQSRPGVTQRGNMLDVTEDIYKKLSPNQLQTVKGMGLNVGYTPTTPSTTTPQNGMSQQNVTTGETIGSVSGILDGMGMSPEDNFAETYYNEQLANYNTPIDETAIRKQKESELFWYR